MIKTYKKKLLNLLYLLAGMVKTLVIFKNINLVGKYVSNLYVVFIGVNLVFLNHYLVNMLSVKLPDYPYFEGVGIYFNFHKKIELIEYILGIIFLGLWFSIVVFGQQHLSQRARSYLKVSKQVLFKRDGLILLGIALAVNLLIPLVIYSIGHFTFLTVMVQLGCLFLAITTPFWGYFIKFGYTGVFSSRQRTKPQKNYSEHEICENKKQKLIWCTLTVFALLFLGYVFYSPITGNPKIINEYFNIPEQTIIETKQENKIVDNTIYWNQHFTSAITFKNDVRRNPSSANINVISERLKAVTQSFNESSLSYNKLKNKFCLNAVTTISDFNNLNSDLFEALNKNHELKMNQSVHSLSNEEKDFLTANLYEVDWQILSRFMIHHNSFMFIPISSIMMHESSAQINAQYGLGNAQLFASFFTHYDGISFDNWLRVSYDFYLVYFVLLVLVAFVITRSCVWTGIILLMSLSIENLHGYDFLLLPPGDSPWRNLLDILVLLSLYLYAINKKTIFYVFALALGVTSVILSPQIGLMILLATIISGVFYAFNERLNIKSTITLSVLALISSVYFLVVGYSVNDLAKYYIDGVIGFQIKNEQLFQLFFVIIVAYTTLWNIIQKRLTKNYVYLIFLIIYAQELLLYVVWHYNGDGFLARGYIYVITILFLAFQFKGSFSSNLKKILCMFVLVGYGYSVIFMLKSQYKYEKIFKQHVTYNWTLDRAHITSTMNPVYFENGVKLIDKYSKNQNGIYIISEYDNFLPFLAHKYSLMPFFDMKWYMITPKELNKTVALLKTRQPEYIFVDTGIDRNLNYEIIDPNFTEKKMSGLYKESIWRVQRLKLLNLVFQSVASNYIMVESGNLISVYKRIN